MNNFLRMKAMCILLVCFPVTAIGDMYDVIETERLPPAECGKRSHALTHLQYERKTRLIIRLLNFWLSSSPTSRTAACLSGDADRAMNAVLTCCLRPTRQCDAFNTSSLSTHPLSPPLNFPVPTPKRNCWVQGVDRDGGNVVSQHCACKCRHIVRAAWQVCARPPLRSVVYLC